MLTWMDLVPLTIAIKTVYQLANDLIELCNHHRMMSIIMHMLTVSTKRSGQRKLYNQPI